MKDTNTKENYASSVVYRIYPKSFFDSDGDGIGDLAGIESRLPYLSALGVDTLVLSAITETDSERPEYGCTNYCRINPAIGTDEEFDSLVNAGHTAGFKIFLSLNLTCTSAQHSWFTQAMESSQNAYKEFYVWRTGKGKNGKHPPNKKRNAFGQNEWTYSESKGEWYKNTFGASFPTLNYQNPRLRKEILDVIRYWLNRNVDGFVIDDAYFAIKKIILSDLKPIYKPGKDFFSSGGGIFQILNEIREKIGRDFPIILYGKNVKPGAFSYLVSTDRAVGDSLYAEHLISNLTYDTSFCKEHFFRSYLSLQRSICKRDLTFAFEDEAHTRMISRFSDGADPAMHLEKMLCTLLLTSTATPSIYQGQEIGMRDFPLRKSVENLIAKDNLHTTSPMQWDNVPSAGFTSGYPYLPINDNYNKINVIAQANDADSLLNYTKHMIAFRKDSTALTLGDFSDHSKGHILSFIRQSDKEKLLIIANTTDKHMNYKVPSDLLEKEAVCEVSNYNVVSKQIFPTMGLRPYEVRIFRMKAPYLTIK